MPIISDTKIAEAARDAGFRGDEIATAVAVALAESGGNTTAVNSKEPDGSTSYGLWQINSVHAGLLKNGDWRNALDNARMAYQVYTNAGKKWTPWGVFNRNRHLLFMPRGILAAKGIPGGAAIAPVPGSDLFPGTEAIGDVKAALDKIGELGKFVTDPHNWLRVGTILIGTSLLAILALNAIRTPVASAAKTVTKVASRGTL